jgi:hypothetical protein
MAEEEMKKLNDKFNTSQQEMKDSFSRLTQQQPRASTRAPLH